MSRPKKDIMKISEQGVITGEALLAYVSNELTDAQKQELEKLLQDDPFAQEALEGLRTTKNNAALTTTILNVNKKVRERTGAKDKKTFTMHWTNYAWAAVVFGLLTGIGFVLVIYLGKKGEQPVAMNQTKEEKHAPVVALPPPVIADSTKANKDSVSVSNGLAATGDTKPNTTVALGNGATGTSNKNVALEQPKQNTAPTGVKGIVAATNTLTANTQAAKPAANITAAPMVASKNVAATQQAAASTTAALAKDKADKKTTDAPGDMQEAMKSFNSGDYKKASDEFDKIMKHDPNNLDALYFGGISDYIDNKTAKSETQFDKVLKKGDKYTDGAKWYKANILLKKGDLEHSKTILQELSNTNNPYKERALKKMAEMGF